MSLGPTEFADSSLSARRDADGREIILSGIGAGVLSLVAVGLAPIPLLLISWRRNVKSGMSALVVALVSAVLMGVPLPVAGGEALSFGWMMHALVGGMRARKSLGRASVVALLPLGLVAVVGPLGLVAFSPERVIQWNQEAFRPAVESIPRLLESSGQSDLRTNALMHEIGGWLTARPFRPVALVPGIFLLTGIVAWAVDLAVVAALDASFGRAAKLLDWRPPAICFWGLSLGLVCVLVGLHFAWGDVFLLVGIDVLLVLFGLYLLSGTAVIAYGLDRLDIPGWARWSVIAGIFLLLGAPFVVVLGLADFWIDFRRRWPPKPLEG